LLESRNRRDFQVFCYSNTRATDELTDRFKAGGDVWRETVYLTDQQFVQMVLQDKIDILIDCANHTRGNRLLAFAQKPAPVQVTYLPYCSTTGLETIDYRITDSYLDPPSTLSTGSVQASSGQAIDTDESMYSERSVRLPHSYWCYVATAQSPPVDAPPSTRNGFITFGCFNSYLKVSGKLLSAWAELLGRVPQSRLLITCRPGSHRSRACELLSSAGIDPGRLRFVDHQPIGEYFRQYHQIDIALDPFPYGGGTTTCDALWMGVPVISLAGQTAVSRAGLSILSNVGLGALVARDVEQYIQIAQNLAADLPRLNELRTTMRGRMQASPLMNVQQFTADFEAALRAMWRDWCRAQ
jgi:predicted O-linked N-acetylglucosamine transferase (SPINDLY family)